MECIVEKLDRKLIDRQGQGFSVSATLEFSRGQENSKPNLNNKKPFTRLLGSRVRGNIYFSSLYM